MKPIPFTFRHIDYFAAVAETGSTAAASRALNVSQPSISLGVARLEEIFGQPLFIRSAVEGMILTPFGRRKLTDLRRVRSHARAALSAGAGQEGTPAELDLGVFSTLGPRYAPALLRRFREAVPNARIHLHEGDLQTLFAWIETGRIDLALVYDFNIPGEVAVEPMRDVKPYALVAADHRMAGRGSVSLAELLEDPLILINLPHSRSYFLSLIQMQGVTANVAMETGSIEMVRTMVANGFGVGLLATELPYRTTYDGGEVAHIAIAGPTPPHRIALACSSRLPPTWVAEAFAETARAFFASGD
jgi:DNA-binding transcriptional LysR family regulator